jgi:PAS domain S-box-containing protein
VANTRLHYIVLGGLLLGAALIVLLSLGASNSEFFATHMSQLLAFTAMAALGLALLFGYQAHSLWRRVKSGVFGSRLTARLFMVFGMMSLIPGLVVYAVSVQFIIGSIESWFDVRVEQALESGLSLGQSALDHLEKDHIKKAETVAQQLADLPPVLHIARLNSLREGVGLRQISLFDSDGRLLGFASADKADVIPMAPERAAVWQARLQQPWSRIEQSDDGKGLTIRVVVPVNLVSLTETLRLLQVTQPVAGKLAEDAQSVERTHRDYQELAVSKLGLKRMYGLALTLTLALTLFSALALAFIISERLAEPLRTLARGTRAVARGDFSQVPASDRRDEFGILTHSFNRMTQQLSDARATAEESRAQLAESKNYLESILGNVSTAVVTLDRERRARLVNPAAADILGVPRESLEGLPLAEWGAPESGLKRFALEMERHFGEHGAHPWRAQVELVGVAGPRQLLARGTPLSTGESPEFALAFDDVTQLIQAQRDAAWGEVARRMAHEIKNPLTPIQLSAERLQVKLEDKLDPTARGVLMRATETIVNQVEAMKSLVNAFSQYARLPTPRLERVELNDLTREVLDLYEGSLPVTARLADDLPPVAGDAALLRQVLVNILKNAQEAMLDSAAPSVYVTTRAEGETVILCIEDNGPGFPENLMSRLFEPYATNKPKGTGLGLPIVKKIVEEHRGVIEIRNLTPRGAGVCIKLPACRAGECA